MDSTIIHIPPELFAPAESIRLEGESEGPVIKAGPDLYTFTTPLTWQVDVTNTGEALLLMGTVEADARTSCARCGEDADVPLFGELEGYYFFNEEDAQDPDMEGDEFGVLPDNRDIDLMPLIQAALLLDIPAIPLCDDDCLGLCPRCGKNLNEGPCACEPAEQEIDPNNPFAALKGFTVEENS